jgi:hypothetical protein
MPIKRAGIFIKIRTARMVFCIPVRPGISTGHGETCWKTVFISTRLMVQAGHIE